MRHKCTMRDNKSREKCFLFEKLKERKHWLDLEVDENKTVLKSMERKGAVRITFSRRNLLHKVNRLLLLYSTYEF
jgi:hypothetical protein